MFAQMLILIWNKSIYKSSVKFDSARSRRMLQNYFRMWNFSFHLNSLKAREDWALVVIGKFKLSRSKNSWRWERAVEKFENLQESATFLI